MPYQGPWSECNHCNINMLAKYKYKTSALFLYTQRYHAPTRVYLDQSRQTIVPGPWSWDARSRAVHLGCWVFSVGVVDSFGYGFVGGQ